LYIPERTVEALNDLYKKVKPSKTAQELLTHMDVFIKISQQSGVNLLTKLIENVQAKFREFHDQGSFRGRSNSMEEL
jgi:hypothetical protein